MEELELHDPEELVARYLERPRPELRELIVSEYSGLVERIARKYAGLEPQSDLIQVGSIGLLNALGKFDQNAKVRFTTYATYLITGEIKHYLRDRSQTIRQPAWLQELRHKVNRTAANLQTEKRRPVTAAEIAAEIGVSESSVQDVLNTNDTLRVSSLDAAANSEEGNAEVNRLESPDSGGNSRHLENRLMIEGAMSQLRDLERQVLTLFHYDALTQNEIAKRLGITPNYVSHVLRQGQAKLRKIILSDEHKENQLRTPINDYDFEIIDRQSGAYTESYFRNRLKEEIHRSTSTDDDVAILIVHFGGAEELKTYHGEQAVDSFLTDAAEFLRNNVRRLDVVARFGELGFGVILPFAGHNARIVRERLAEKAVNWRPNRLNGNASSQVFIGEAWASANGKSLNSMIKAAESAMDNTVV